MTNAKAVEWCLRIGVFLTFTGHGILAFMGKDNWMPYLTFWGFSEETALVLMKVIGVLDVLVAITVLIKPVKAVVLYAAIWAFCTALMRPLSGEPILEFIERGINFMAPLALYFYLRSHQQKHHS